MSSAFQLPKKEFWLYILKSLWLLACIAAAAFGLYFGHDADIVAILVLAVLTFPLGLAGVAIFMSFTHVFHILEKSSLTLQNAVLFIPVIAIGYWQWFVIAPKFWIYLKPKMIHQRNLFNGINDRDGKGDFAIAKRFSKRPFLGKAIHAFVLLSLVIGVFILLNTCGHS